MLIVTGGAGFIGSNIVKALNREGYDDILIVDNLEKGEKHLNLNSLRFNDFIDKRDFIAREALFRNEMVEAVFHQGACSNTMEYDGRYMLRENYETSKTLLHACLRERIPFIYASSASVYGMGENGFTEKEECEYPLNVYAFSKYLFDRYVRRVLPKASSPVVGLRYFNVYGPQENHKGRMASVIFHFHNQIKEEGRIKIFEGSEGFRRDFVFVEDAVKVNMFFFRNPEKSGIFNCGTGEAQPFAAIAEKMKVLYENVEVTPVPFPEKLKGKYQAYTQADLANLRTAGYADAFTPLTEGVARYVEVLQTTGGYWKV